ncbi:MAG: S8 family peptidase [Saprospiraceae bacterium]|nr:S8 family peptidase [Saprospiraceae bacterium]
MNFKHIVLAALLAGQSFVMNAQDKAPENWFNLDLKADGVFGVSTEKAYKELLKDKKPKKTIIVAVIDSGVDAEHEDLKDVMWVNEKEVPNNGKDDDGNGYIDDVHGWNFIGGKDGENVDHDTYELTRLYKELKNKKRSGKEEKRFQKIKKVYESKRDELEQQNMTVKAILDALTTVKEHVGKDNYTAEELTGIETEDEKLKSSLAMINRLFLNTGAEDYKELNTSINEWGDYLKNGLDYGYNVDFNPRTIVGDDYTNVDDKIYGNADVEGPDAGHGTHVAGIIAAVRGNEVGMDGVANNVRIMGVRAVPNGDERDKDVANAIRYAVDNGAQVINMSFGKGYAYNKKAVDAAIKYAEKNDVLLVHAAGNSSLNIDEESNFPTKRYGNGKKTAKNWLEVGALNWKDGADSPAPFSNYGKGTVDLFAPGVDIFSTMPDDKYEALSGTSMASPVTAGVAALVLSYYPELSAAQLKDILVSTVEPLEEKVKRPGSATPNIQFEELSITGGVVNVFKALEKADKTQGKRK